MGFFQQDTRFLATTSDCFSKKGYNRIPVISSLNWKPSFLPYNYNMQQPYDVDFRNIPADKRLEKWFASIFQITKKVLERLNNQEYQASIHLKINLPNGLRFQLIEPNSPLMQTNQDFCSLTYPMNVRTIDPENVSEVKINNLAITFHGEYKLEYTVPNFIRIMIAEQIRFSTLRDLYLKNINEKKKNPPQWGFYFKYFYDNYKHSKGAYNGWKNKQDITFQAELLDNKVVMVEILVPWQFDLDFNWYMTKQNPIQLWNKDINGLRQRVLNARDIPNQTNILMRVYLPPGLEFQYQELVDKGKKQKKMPTDAITSQDKRFLIYNLDLNNIYGSSLKIEGDHITFIPGYRKNMQYDVSDFTGIMISEQIRFSTLQDSLTSPQRFEFEPALLSPSWQGLYKHFKSNYLVSSYGHAIYNSWKDAPSDLLDQYLAKGTAVKVRILVRHRTVEQLPENKKYNKPK